MSIRLVEGWVAVFPIETPFDLGAHRLTHRDYLVLRLTDSAGPQGFAYCLARGGSFEPALRWVAAHVLGREAAEAREVISGQRWDADRARGRTRSLADIALWDISARLAGLPLWALLGGSGGRAGVVSIDGYPIPGEGDRAFARRLADRVHAGASAMKLRSLPDADATNARLAATRAAVGPDIELIVDVGWDMAATEDAIDAERRWRQHGLTWIEDPFPASAPAATAALRRAAATQVAAGDEFDPAAIDELLRLDAVDVLRLDATTVGGVTGFLDLYARAGGREVSPHVNIEVHQHLAFGLAQVRRLEAFPDRRFDATCAFVSPDSLRWSAPDHICAPQGPGLGLEMDWAAVESASIHIVKYEQHDIDSSASGD